MPLISPLTGYIVVAALLAIATAGGVGYLKGRQSAQTECKTAALRQTVDELQAALAAEMVSDQAAQQTRTVIRTEIEAIHVDTQHSIQVVEASWDRPVCDLPVPVRNELQTRIDQANTAARGL